MASVRNCARASLFLLVAMAAAATAADAPVRAYVETSYVVAPQRVAGFRLADARFDPQNKYAGAGFTYKADEDPRPVISVFVYPAGRMAQDEAPRDGMAAFRHDLQRARETGTYDRLETGIEDAFPLAAHSDASDTSDLSQDAELLATIASYSRIDGRRLGLKAHLARQDLELRSVGFLFYRQLYYFKVRVSVEAGAMASDAFDRFADRAARTLVPAIQAVHVGDCANASITVPDDNPEEAARILVREATLQQGYNCHADRMAAGIDALSRDARVIEIGYTANEWMRA